MNKNKMLIFFTIIIAIMLCIPSIDYLITNGTIDKFNSWYSYELIRPRNAMHGITNGIIIISLLLIFSFLYFLIIKKQNKIFKSAKQIIALIAIISFVFMLILPYLSSDIYYYIGDSWLASRYNENPYYVTVENLQEQGKNDEILDNTGYWKATTTVYGPIWNSIAKFLVSFSFGSITVALFIFKAASYLIHVLNSYLIYKITKSKKYMLIYGLNPFVLIQFLSNVHNDIYLVLFILLALYFLVKKKNIIFTLLFLAISISIKYSTVLLVPFILIYCFRNKTIPKRILYCMISGISIIAMIILFYLPYYKDITVFTNMLVQGDRYSQSIMAILMENLPSNIYNIIYSTRIYIYAFIYAYIVFTVLFNKKLTSAYVMRKYNFVLLIFIFLVLTNFQPWYITWILPTIPWQSRYMRRFLLSMTITALLTPIRYFMVGSDPFIYGISYSWNILIISGLFTSMSALINNYKNTNKEKLEKEKICHD